MRLFSYCLRYDDGAAPNPYWGVCTLVICKPAIRRTAEIGDWIAGLGSTNSPIGDISTRLVYAILVTDKKTMEAYDKYCTENYPNKIPVMRSRDYRLRMGDCIYNYSSGSNPVLRWSVHKEENRKRDLEGEYALLSKHFYYFGDHPVPLPEGLFPIIHAARGHKSDANQPYIQPFIEWIENIGYQKNKIYGEPQLKEKFSRDSDIQIGFSARCLKGEPES